MIRVRTERYGAVDGSRLSNKDAERYGQYLEGLETRFGALTPDLIVHDAKRKKSPLHGYFEWNDTVAAHQYRLRQARKLLQSIKVVIGDVDDAAWPQAQSRAFMNVTTKDEAGKLIRVYLSTERVLEDETLTASVLAQMKRDLLNFRDRYKNFLGMADHFQELEDIITRVLGMGQEEIDVVGVADE